MGFRPWILRGVQCQCLSRGMDRSAILRCFIADRVRWQQTGWYWGGLLNTKDRKMKRRLLCGDFREFILDYWFPLGRSYFIFKRVLNTYVGVSIGLPTYLEWRTSALTQAGNFFYIVISPLYVAVLVGFSTPII